MPTISRAVARIVPPLTAMFVPETLATTRLLARTTGWSGRQISLDGRANAFGRQTFGPWWRWRRVLFPSLVVDELNPVVFLRRWCGRDASGLVEAEFADVAGGGPDFGGDLLIA